MTLSIDIWKLLAGIAIFLLGMKFLEESLQQMAGRPFKLFLKKQTSSKPKAILGGAVVTGVLQSSSVVNLMVLAFVGANVIEMQHALAVILGANLGTTFDSWIVATVGFKLNIGNLAYPMAGISGIIMSLSGRGDRLYQWSRFLLGFGFLLLGLDFMKTGMEDVVKQVDLSAFDHYPVIVFLLLGFIITSLIQSSSATIAIVLSALHVHAIGLLAATAIVLGSEVGTTIKLVLASVKSVSAKKRVALGNLLFNVVTTLLVFIFLLPINRFIKEVMLIQDDLLSLVFFQTMVNVAGIILFYPFLNSFGKFLEKRFITSADTALFIHKVNVHDTELAMMALENEIKYFILYTINFARGIFDRPDEVLQQTIPGHSYHSKKTRESYDYLKHLHGELHGYAIKLQNTTSTDAAITQRLDRLTAANRNIMYASKSIKDALPDIAQLRNSSNNLKYRFYRQSAEKLDEFCKRISTLILHAEQVSCFDELTDIYRSVALSYSLVLQQLYTENMHSRLSEIDISTLINFNRDMYTAYKSYVFAVKDYLLDPRQAAYFDELPGFIR